MYVITLVLAAAWALPGMATLSGQVVDLDGGPVVGARVFMEAGLDAALVATTSAADGAWRFEDVPPGNIGVFAIAESLAFGGTTVALAGESTASDIVIRLGRPAEISGKVTDAKGHPVEGARVTRVALLGTDKVGIPLSKLKAFGFEEPVSDAKGHITVPRLPEDATVAIKAGHPDYAQEAISDIRVGDSAIRIALYRGALVEGDVFSQDGKRPVEGAIVTVRNAQPPHDTAVTKTNQTGGFAVRLKPGVYLYKATTGVYQSPGWTQLTLMSEENPPRLKLYLAGTGRILGKVFDAVSGAPIEGVKLSLNTQGNMAAIARTGSDGAFVFDAMAGENVVCIEEAAGYAKPPKAGVRMQVAEGKETTLPTFWLAPIPAGTVEAVGAEIAPAPSSDNGK